PVIKVTDQESAESLRAIFPTPAEQAKQKNKKLILGTIGGISLIVASSTVAILKLNSLENQQTETSIKTSPLDTNLPAIQSTLKSAENPPSPQIENPILPTAEPSSEAEAAPAPSATPSAQTTTTYPRPYSFPTKLDPTDPYA